MLMIQAGDMIKAGQQRRFEMESTQEEKLNSVDVSLLSESMSAARYRAHRNRQTFQRDNESTVVIIPGFKDQAEPREV